MLLKISNLEKFKERAIRFQKRQKFSATNTFCREKYEGGFVREYMYDDIYKFTARRILKECMAANGYENVECGYYGVCEQKWNPYYSLLINE